ncbi:MAG: hypothetical protein ACRDJK_14625, partial [Actinomycetota bacterium]
QRAVNLYLDHWKTFVGIVAVVIVPFTFLQAFLAASGMASFKPGVIPSPEIVFHALGPGLIALVLAFLVTSLVTAASTRAAADIYLGRQVTLRGVYGLALDRLGPMLVALLLAGLIVVGGFFLLIIHGILFLVRVGFVPAAVMLEGAGGTEAIRRSWRLAKGDGWRIFGILLSTIIISGVVGFLLSFPFGRLARAMGAGGWWLAAFGEALANVVTTPFGAIVFVLAYFDLRIRKEGLDP